MSQQKAGYADMAITQEQVDAINALGAQGNVFERLAASIAPEIFGMRDVKKVCSQGGPAGWGALSWGAAASWACGDE